MPADHPSMRRKGGEVTTVRQQQTKCKALRKHLVAVVDCCTEEWTLMPRIVEWTQNRLKVLGIHTTGEVLAKELRKACRKGEIRKRIRPGTVYVEYTACLLDGKLFDNTRKHHGE